jgi:hypothetical protein
MVGWPMSDAKATHPSKSTKSNATSLLLYPTLVSINPRQQDVALVASMM